MTAARKIIIAGTVPEPAPLEISLRVNAAGENAKVSVVAKMVGARRDQIIGTFHHTEEGRVMFNLHILDPDVAAAMGLEVQPPVEAPPGTIRTH